MIYTDETKKALKLCFEAHKNQVDKSGMPYVFHPFHVAEQMTDEATTIVALLHDVVEDTDYTLEDLAAEGFGEDILEAVALMTHEDDVPYLDYVAKLKDNPIARAVKLADLAHNSDLSRIGEVDEETRERLEKYQKAIALLKGNPLRQLKFMKRRGYRCWEQLLAISLVPYTNGTTLKQKNSLYSGRIVFSRMIPS